MGVVVTCVVVTGVVVIGVVETGQTGPEQSTDRVSWHEGLVSVDGIGDLTSV